MVSDGESMRILRALDEGTEWELPREVYDREWNPDDSVATMPTESLDTEEEVEDSPKNLLQIAVDWEKSGIVEDITIIINDTNDDQHLLTSLNRNDLILGQLEIAKLNWHSLECGMMDVECDNHDEDDLEEV